MSILFDFKIFQKEWEKIPKNNVPKVALLYPVLNIGASADMVAPHSLYYIQSTLKELDVLCDIYFWDINGTPEEADVYYVHPMFATIEKCCKSLGEIKDKAIICLGNSDQHQHEMCLGGLQGKKIAHYLLSRYPYINLIFSGKNHEYSISCMIQNIMLKRPLTFQLNEEHIFSLDSLPFMYLPQNYPQVVRIRSSVGCRAVCTYCIESSSNNTNSINWIGMEGKRFVDEIEHIVHVFNRRIFNITDSSFEDAESKGNMRLMTIVNDLIDRNIGISLKIHLRSETVKSLTDDEILKLKKAGIDIIVIGVESGVDTDLKEFKKISSADTAKDTINRLDKTGLFFTILGYLMFTPFTTLELLRQKINYLNDLNRCWDYMNMTNWLLVYYGSRMHDNLLKKKLVKCDEDPIAYVSYNFSDENVRKIAQTMNMIKKRVPEVMNMHKLFYDGYNVFSRLKDPLKQEFKVFFEKFFIIQRQIGKLYYDIMLKLIDISPQYIGEISIAEDMFLPVKEIYFTLKQDFQELISKDILFVDTWFSNVNVFGLEK
ncbi:MAG: radical SAM protein [Desulfobacterales bacterium]|nr:radical SAM protein [Desulfobacterales bacterium]